MSSTVSFSVSNTQVSGNALQSALTEHGIRDLEFDASCRSHNALVVSSSTASVLTTNQWIQASISALLLDASGLSSGVSTINLGSGTSQAMAYINFFDLSSGDQRVVKMGPLVAKGSGSVIMQGDATFLPTLKSGASSAASNILLDAQSSAWMRVVEIYATNTDVGSASVSFNILS